MHDDEVEVSDNLVLSLLTEQTPHLADRPLRRLDTWGTEHVIYRLGGDLSVRLPKIGAAADQGERERRWLPLLAPHLPVHVPTPVFVGRPSRAYPYAWYLSPWLEGSNPDTADPPLAVDLAATV